MDHRLFLLLSCSLLAVASLVAGDDAFIRQVVDDRVQSLNTEEHLHHFGVFRRKFGKSYASQEEHDYRFTVFKTNLRRAKRHQKLDPSAVHGITQFSDMTPSEFRKHLGLRSRLRFPADASEAPILPTNDLPDDFDWRDHGAVTNVKNQVLRFTQSVYRHSVSNLFP